MMAITKPPWVWEKVTGEGKVTESSLRGPETVLCRYWYDNPPAQDARLIAAAPELYEACKEMMIRLADIFNRFERPTYYVDSTENKLHNWTTAKYGSDQWDSLPKIPACYVLYYDGKLVYVGSTSNLRHRITSYRIRYSYGNSVFIGSDYNEVSTVTLKYRLTRKYGDWAMIELRLIRKLKPQLNKLHKQERRESDMVPVL
jgi:hypothetical protein